LEPIESTLQLSLLKQFLPEQKELANDGNKFYASLQKYKRTPRTIGKRGTRDTDFFHPSSLAYSKRDELICKLKKKFFFFKF
jgi:hypothetical protein